MWCALPVSGGRFDLFLFVAFIAVNGFKLLAGGRNQSGELPGALDFSQILFAGSLIIFGAQPASRPLLADGSCEGLVEIGITPGKNTLMAEFMKNSFGQIRFDIENECVQRGVFEPAQG